MPLVFWLRSPVALKCRLINKSAWCASAKVTRFEFTKSTSFVRVRKTVQPFVSSKGLSRNAVSSVNSFSMRPSKTLTVPELCPPWPGSITMTRLVCGSASSGSHRSGSKCFCKSAPCRKISLSINCGAKPKFKLIPFHVTSRLPMPKTIAPFGESMTNAVSDKSFNRCGAFNLCSAAHCASEVHVVTGAAICEFVFIGDGFFGTDVNVFCACGFVQFSSGETFLLSTGSMTFSGGFEVEQPAMKIAAAKIIPAFLNTRPLCEMEIRTQAVSPLSVKNCSAIMLRVKILVAITGASGAIYAQRLLDNLDPHHHEIHVVQSNYAQQVIAEELPGGLKLPDGVKIHGLKSMNAPFASGSNPPDAMVVIPCTMGTMGRIAHGYSEDVLLRAADVTLKEKRKLILVPRETPLSLVHIKNFELLALAGAILLPANPSFYAGPKTIVDVVDTVVARVLDHLGVANTLAPRWSEEKE